MAYNLLVLQAEQRKKAMIEFERRRKLAVEQDAAQLAIRRQAYLAFVNAPLNPVIPFSLTIASVVFAMISLIPVATVGLWLWLTSRMHTGPHPSFDGSIGMFLGPVFAYFFGGGAYFMTMSVTCSAVAQHKSERYIQVFNLTLIAITTTPYVLGFIYLLFQAF